VNYLLRNIVLIVLILYIKPLFAISSDWASSDVSKVRVISPYTAINDQKELTLGLEYKLNKGWKTYWKSPGDGGFAQNINWKNSKNIKNLYIEWPTPKKFEILGLNSIGYENKVLFPLVIEIINPNEDISLDLELNYLVCNNICIPGDARIFFDIPSGKGQTTSFHFDIEKAKSLLPQNNKNLTSLESLNVEAFKKNKSVVIKIIASTHEIFNNPKIFLHTFFGLPVVEEQRKYSMDLSEISSSFSFDKELFIKDEFEVEIVFVNNDLSYIFKDEVKLKKINNFQILDSVILFYFSSALLGGLILNFMPCVFPILSIKLLRFLQTDKKTVRVSFFTTSLGIITSFVLLALMFFIFKIINIDISWGMQFQQPYFLMMIFLILAIFMMSMFDLFQFRLPQIFSSLIFIDSYKTKFGKDFFNGFFATLLATPCSAPFIGTAVTFAFTQSSFVLFGIFIFMGIGMSSPYLLVTMFPFIINFLPKPGKWMIYVRYFLGFLLLLTIIWILSILNNFFNIYFLIILPLLFIVTFILLKTKIFKFIPIVIFIFIFYNLPLFEIFKKNNSNNLDDNWIDLFSVKIDDLIQTDQIVFLDITADWCATCKFNKINVLNSKKIKKLFKNNNTILLQADWTKPDKRINNFLNQYNKFGIPFNILISQSYPEGIIFSELLSEKDIIDGFNKINE